MGITIHYKCLPASLDQATISPAENRLMDQSMSIAKTMLETAGVPYVERDRNITGRYCEASLELVGSAAGSELLTFGWSLKRDRWNGLQVIKTQYAADFMKTHVLVAEILWTWQGVGLIAPDIYDEGAYLPHRDLDQLAESQAMMAVISGQIDVVLQKLGLTYETSRPGGGTYRHWPRHLI